MLHNKHKIYQDLCEYIYNKYKVSVIKDLGAYKHNED